MGPKRPGSAGIERHRERSLGVRNVFSETQTARPDGICFARGPLGSWRKRLGYFAASPTLVMTITATYHLGYDHYRESGVGAPETGNVLMSMPMLLTANPIGSVVDHSAMHVAAVIHEYEDDTRLPPQTDAD